MNERGELTEEENIELWTEVGEAEVQIAELIQRYVHINECSVTIALLSIASSVSFQSGFVDKKAFIEQCESMWDRAVKMHTDYHKAKAN